MTENAPTAATGHSPQGPSIDVDTVARQIARLPLAIPEIAEEQLAALLDDLLASHLPAEELYFLLEYVRSPLSFVREAAVRHYCTQAPMLDHEADIHFQKGIDAWQRMVRAYSKCLDGLEPDSRAEALPHRASIIHRCLCYQGLTIFEHYRAKRRLPPGLWRQFHGLYAAAEKFGGTRQSVRDELFDEIRVTDCQAAYIAPILLSAAKPFGHDSQQLEVISRWTVQWAHLATIHSAPPKGEFTGFVVDQAEDSPHLFDTDFAPGDNRRLLDTTSLTAHLKRVLELLERRPPPESFGLTEDNISWTRPLLSELAGAWTACHDSRRAPRLSNRSALRLSAGFDQIHALLVGQGTGSPESLESLEIMRATERPGEDWYLVEESETGCRLVHPAPRIRLQIHQLALLCGQDPETNRLAQAQWLMQDGLRGIVAGVALLPGHPVGVTLRSDVGKDGASRFVSRGFVLLGQGKNHAVTLVLPKGIFQAGRVVSVAGGDTRRIRMQDVLQSGTDFDHVSVRPSA